MRELITLPGDGVSIFAGMGDLELVTPRGMHRVQIKYREEPPHGDSYHDISIDGVKLPGYAWGCRFACTDDERFLAFSWMAKLLDRTTIVVDMRERRYFILPEYIYDFVFRWPRLEGIGRRSPGNSFEFIGNERWLGY